MPDSYHHGVRVQEINSGGRVIQTVATAIIGLVSRNKRRYGGYIVHLGIVLIFLGFAGEVLMKPQQTKNDAATNREE